MKLNLRNLGSLRKCCEEMLTDLSKYQASQSQTLANDPELEIGSELLAMEWKIGSTNARHLAMKPIRQASRIGPMLIAFAAYVQLLSKYADTLRTAAEFWQNLQEYAPADKLEELYRAASENQPLRKIQNARRNNPRNLTPEQKRERLKFSKQLHDRRRAMKPDTNLIEDHFGDPHGLDPFLGLTGGICLDGILLGRKVKAATGEHSLQRLFGMDRHRFASWLPTRSQKEASYGYETVFKIMDGLLREPACGTRKTWLHNDAELRERVLSAIGERAAFLRASPDVLAAWERLFLAHPPPDSFGETGFISR